METLDIFTCVFQIEQVCTYLEGWLNEASEAGRDDDITGWINL